MRSRGNPNRRFLRAVRRAAPRAVEALAQELGIGRAVAGEALAAAAALGLAGLARHQRRRPLEGNAAFRVARKYGRPADLEAPELGIAAHLARPGLSPRLGGLLGDAGPRVAEWLAARCPGATPEQIGRALAAVTPLVLGALADSVEPTDLTDWLVEVPEAPLEDPSSLLSVAGAPSEAYLSLRRLGQPWWQRALGLGS